MLTVNELRDLIRRSLRRLDPISVPLESAVGCRLAAHVCADADLPAFDRSSIDGYAVRETAGPGRFRLVGEIPPGVAPGAGPNNGEAVRIFTGSAVPAGAGLVMLEDGAVEGDAVLLNRGPNPDLIRRRASQAALGSVVLPAGSALTAGAAALLATVGAGAPTVFPRPAVAHLSTGSELVDVEAAPGPGCIRDSNAPLISCLILEAGARQVFRGRVDESVESAVATLSGVSWDVLLISGGASVGRHDGSGEVLRRLGYEIQSTKVKSRPGKPLIFGVREGLPGFALPGNPLSHFVCFHLFVRPALDALAGRPPQELVTVEVESLPAPDPRETWWPARVSVRDARLTALPLPWTDSSDLIGLARANALLRVPSVPTNGLAQALVFGTLER